MNYTWCSPVGNPDLQLYPPPGWSRTNWIGAYYKLNNTKWQYHTGDDLDMPGNSDVGQFVRAIHNGVVTFAQDGTSTWLGVVVVRHEVDDKFVYARYAHLDPNTIKVKVGDKVAITQDLGFIVNPRGRANFQPHFHFDIGATNDNTLFHYPTNWPGMNRVFIMQHYQSPLNFLIDRLDKTKYAECLWTTTALRVRESATLQAKIIKILPQGYPLRVSKQEVISQGEIWVKIEWTPDNGDKSDLVGKWCAKQYLEKKQ